MYIYLFQPLFLQRKQRMNRVLKMNLQKKKHQQHLSLQTKVNYIDLEYMCKKY